MQAGNMMQRGFTLMEMVVTIAVLSIVSVSIGMFILPAVTAQKDLERRAALVDAAENALHRMARDIRLSVPNSLRINNTIVGGSGFALELVPTADGARYCITGTADCSTVPGNNVLTIAAGDNAFDILGCFRNTTFTAATTGYRFVINNTGSLIYTATTNNAVITLAATTYTVTVGAPTPTGACGSLSGTANSFWRHRVTLSAAHTFPTASPRHRVYVVEHAASPVSYICNFTNGTLTRFAGYKDTTVVPARLSTVVQPTNVGAAPLNSVTGRVIASNVSSCSINSDVSKVQGTMVLTLTLSLTDSGETVQLVEQVHIDNSL